MINYTNMIMCSDCKRHIITQESIEIVKIVCFSIVLICIYYLFDNFNSYVFKEKKWNKTQFD